MMQSVKNALGVGATGSTYGATLPMGSTAYGSSLGGTGLGMGYGSQYGTGLASGYSSGLGASGLSTGLASPVLPAQTVVQTTTVPIEAPMSPAPMTPSQLGGSQFGGSQFGGSQYGGQLGNQQFGGSQLGSSQFGGQQLGSQQFGGQQLGSSQFGGQQLGNQQFGGQQLGSSQFGGQQLGGSQFGGQQLGSQQFGGQQLGSQQFGGQQLSQQCQKQYQQGFVQRREAAPVVFERIRREEVEEVQPVIHREREKTEIHKITQPIQTSSTLGIITEEGTLPAQVNPEIRTPGMMSPPAPIGSREVLSGQRMRVEKPAMVIETEKKNIIEEVQPVYFREVVEPHIIKLTQPIYERIVEGDVYYTETLPARSDFSGQFQQQQFQQPLQQQLGQQQLLQPIQVQTTVQPIPVPMASPLPSMGLIPKENLEVAATYVSEFGGGVVGKGGRWGTKKGTAYAYGPGSSAAPIAQPRAV